MHETIATASGVSDPGATESSKESCESQISGRLVDDLIGLEESSLWLEKWTGWGLNQPRFEPKGTR